MSIIHNGINFKVADSHAHIYPHKIAEKATASVGSFYNIPMELVGSSEMLKKYGSKAGTDKYLVCSVATKPEQVSHINKFISEECSKHPDFIGFGAFHQDISDFDVEIHDILSYNFPGIKLHPDFQRFNIDDPKMLPAYKAVAEAGLFILFHMGDDRYDFSNPRRLLNVIEQIPELKCIAAHFGGYRKWDYAYSVLREANVYFDTSSTLAFLPPEQAADMIRTYGADKMLFGTDFPMWNPVYELERFFALGLSEEENTKILYNNFENAFLKNHL